MKNSFLIMLIVFILFPQGAYANAKVIGNGGSAVVCRYKNGKIKSAVLLDIYEGIVLHNLSYPDYSTLPFKKIADKKILSLSKNLVGSADTALENNYKKFQKNINLLPAGTTLMLTNDFGNIIIPKACELSQVVNYRNDGSVYMNAEIFNSLDNLSKAALYVHEALYATIKQPLYLDNEIVFNEIDSTRVRRTVANLFSTKDLEQIKIEFTQLPKWEMCYGQDKSGRFTTWFSRGVLGTKTQLRFYFLNSKIVLSQTTIDSDYNYPGTEIGHFDGMLNSQVDFDVKIKTSIPEDGKEYIEIIDLNNNVYVKVPFNCEGRSSH